MTVGQRIKRIRQFRGLTQKQLGVAVGFSEKNADNRIAQYETDYRVPKKETLTLIAKALNVNAFHFISNNTGTAEEIMVACFWLDEKNNIRGNEFLNMHLMEWIKKKRLLGCGKITENEYFEWKINWSYNTNE